MTRRPFEALPHPATLTTQEEALHEFARCCEDFLDAYREALREQPKDWANTYLRLGVVIGSGLVVHKLGHDV